MSPRTPLAHKLASGALALTVLARGAGAQATADRASLRSPLAVAGSQQDRARAAEFDAYVTRAAAEWKTVGLAVTVVRDGQVVFAKGYGTGELGTAAPVDTATLFAIGSTTKAITAAALGMLVDEGKVRWDDPVSSHLPWFQLADPYATRELTVRDLLTHRAGLANADVLWYHTDLTPHEILRRARFIPAAYSFRSGFVYQNIMYAAAGAVVAAASGMPWETFVQRRIFEPLGMTRTVPTLAATRGMPNVAAPHHVVDGVTRVIENAPVDAVAAAGSIWSSVADMGKWARFMLDSGRVNGRRLLQPATWGELLRPQSLLDLPSFYPATRLTGPQFSTYGLGWFQADYAGRMIQFHTGSIDGMVAIIGLVPSERLGVYVLANRDHVEIRHALMYRAFDTWLGTGSRDWSREMLALYTGLATRADSLREAVARARVQGTTPSLPLSAYAGTYADSLIGTVRVVERDGVLHLEVSSTQTARLDHWHYDTFMAVWNRPWQEREMVTFRLDPRGASARLELGGVSLGRVPRR